VPEQITFLAAHALIIPSQSEIAALANRFIAELKSLFGNSFSLLRSNNLTKFLVKNLP
jgi:hypothetical protein